VLLGSEIIKALNLDTQIEPGYSYFYSFSKFLVGLLILLMILILWCWVLVPLFSPVFRWWWKGGKEKKEEEKK
jgi:antibiotic biosynthesis monooxygenase (ABM) superfamily enzyme